MPDIITPDISGGNPELSIKSLLPQKKKQPIKLCNFCTSIEKIRCRELCKQYQMNGIKSIYIDTSKKSCSGLTPARGSTRTAFYHIHKQTRECFKRRQPGEMTLDEIRKKGIPSKFYRDHQGGESNEKIIIPVDDNVVMDRAFEEFDRIMSEVVNLNDTERNDIFIKQYRSGEKYSGEHQSVVSSSINLEHVQSANVTAKEPAAVLPSADKPVNMQLPTADSTAFPSTVQSTDNKKAKPSPVLVSTPSSDAVGISQQQPLPSEKSCSGSTRTAFYHVQKQTRECFKPRRPGEMTSDEIMEKGIPSTFYRDHKDRDSKMKVIIPVDDKDVMDQAYEEFDKVMIEVVNMNEAERNIIIKKYKSGDKYNTLSSDKGQQQKKYEPAAVSAVSKTPKQSAPPVVPSSIMQSVSSKSKAKECVPAANVQTFAEKSTTNEKDEEVAMLKEALRDKNDQIAAKDEEIASLTTVCPPSKRQRINQAKTLTVHLSKEYTTCSICQTKYSTDMNNDDDDIKKHLPVLSASSKSCDHCFCHGCILKQQAAIAEEKRIKVPKWIPCMVCRTKTAFCPSEPKYHRLLIDILREAKWTDTAEVKEEKAQPDASQR